MELFTNQVLAGIATGAIYACMALAVVMIYQAIDHLNFAQGEMAMFSTFISWQMMQWGVPYWGAFVLTLAFAFAGGILIERLLFKPLAKAPILTNVAGFIALYAIINSVAGLIWDFTIKQYPTPFGSTPFLGSQLISTHQAGTLSGGEQQMLAVARALMLRPRLMLLDEPSFGLAPLIVRDLFKILGKINREDKVTILVVEQNAQLALELADQAYVIETGKIVMSGNAKDIANNEDVRKSYLGY